MTAAVKEMPSGVTVRFREHIREPHWPKDVLSVQSAGLGSSAVSVVDGVKNNPMWRLSLYMDADQNSVWWKQLAASNIRMASVKEVTLDMPFYYWLPGCGVPGSAVASAVLDAFPDIAHIEPRERLLNAIQVHEGASQRIHIRIHELGSLSYTT